MIAQKLALGARPFAGPFDCELLHRSTPTQPVDQPRERKPKGLVGSGGGAGGKGVGPASRFGT